MFLHVLSFNPEKLTPLKTNILMSIYNEENLLSIQEFFRTQSTIFDHFHPGSFTPFGKQNPRYCFYLQSKAMWDVFQKIFFLYVMEFSILANVHLALSYYHVKSGEKRSSQLDRLQSHSLVLSMYVKIWLTYFIQLFEISNHRFIFEK